MHHTPYDNQIPVTFIHFNVRTLRSQVPTPEMLILYSYHRYLCSYETIINCSCYNWLTENHKFSMFGNSMQPPHSPQAMYLYLCIHPYIHPSNYSLSKREFTFQSSDIPLVSRSQPLPL